MKKIYIYTFKKLNEVNSTMNIQQKVPFGELQRGTVRVGGEGVRGQDHGAASLEAGNMADGEAEASMGSGAPETCGRD